MQLVENLNMSFTIINIKVIQNKVQIGFLLFTQQKIKNLEGSYGYVKNQVIQSQSRETLNFTFYSPSSFYLLYFSFFSILIFPSPLLTPAFLQANSSLNRRKQQCCNCGGIRMREAQPVAQPQTRRLKARIQIPRGISPLPSTLDSRATHLKIQITHFYLFFFLACHFKLQTRRSITALDITVVNPKKRQKSNVEYEL